MLLRTNRWVPFSDWIKLFKSYLKVKDDFFFYWKVKNKARCWFCSGISVFHLPAIIHDEWHKQIFNRHNSNLKGELGIRGDPGRVPSVPIINVRVVVLVVGGLHVILSEPQPLWPCQFVSVFYTRTLWKQFFSAAPGNHRQTPSSTLETSTNPSTLCWSQWCISFSVESSFSEQFEHCAGV